VWRSMQLEDDILGYQPGHLLAGCCTSTTGVGTVVFAYLKEQSESI